MVLGPFEKPETMSEAIRSTTKFKKTRAHIGKPATPKEIQEHDLRIERVKQQNDVYDPIISSYPLEKVEIDLLDVHPGKYRQIKNRGVRYVLIIIDVHSRYAWGYLLTNKRGETVENAFRHWLSKFVPGLVISDEGSEFTDVRFKNLLNDFGVEHYVQRPGVRGLEASAIRHVPRAERFNSTLRGYIDRVKLINGSETWVDQFQEILDTYNTSYHDGIKDTPKNILLGNYALETTDSPSGVPGSQPAVRGPLEKLELGTIVRLRLFKKNQFEKGRPKWSRALFEIIGYDGNKYIIDDSGISYFRRELLPSQADFELYLKEKEPPELQPGRIPPAYRSLREALRARPLLPYGGSDLPE